MSGSVWLLHHRGAPPGRRVAFVVAAVIVAALCGIVLMSNNSSAATAHTVTFVNNSGETIWIGTGANADGSLRINHLPVLANGASASVIIPDNGRTNHWRGKFFARQRCSGVSGSTFHCLVGDCGVYADRCVLGEQPASLAEFNFDRSDKLAPWYDVSYVNALSLPITVAPRPASPSRMAGICTVADCSGGELLATCPTKDTQHDPRTGQRLFCLNPNRDTETGYTRAINAYHPLAYTWSTQDRVPGNLTVFDCPSCSAFVVAFGGAAIGKPLASEGTAAK